MRLPFIITCVLALASGTLSCAARTPGLPWVRVAAQARSQVVRVEDGADAKAAATGFFISEQRVLSAWSPISDAQSIRIRAPDGSWSGARVVAVDKANDLALIEPVAEPAAPATPMKLAPALPAPGEQVLIAGYPGEYGLSVARTTVSATGVPLESDSAEQLILLQGSPRKGLGGAPVLDEQGRVLGLVLPRTRPAHGFSRVLPAPVLIAALAALESGDQTSPTWEELGLTLRELPDLRSLQVEAVEEGSAAAAAGLAPGDIISGLAGRRAGTLAFAGEILARWRTAAPINLVVHRAGDQLKLALRPAP